MTNAQKIWFERFKGWERQQPGSNNRAYIHNGIVDSDSKFSLAPSSDGTDGRLLKDDDILVGMPA